MDLDADNSSGAGGNSYLASYQSGDPPVAISDTDVLITDIEMPRMDGRTLCETLHAEQPEREFPIFVVTSLTEREHRSWSSTIENLYFLEKPISVRKLLARLTECTGVHRMATQA